MSPVNVLFTVETDFPQTLSVDMSSTHRMEFPRNSTERAHHFAAAHSALPYSLTVVKHAERAINMSPLKNVE